MSFNNVRAKWLLQKLPPLTYRNYEFWGYVEFICLFLMTRKVNHLLFRYTPFNDCSWQKRSRVFYTW